MRSTPSGRAKGIILAAATVAAGGFVDAQRVKIDRCAPSLIQSGEPVEVTLGGSNLERAELWTSFPSTVERLDETAPRFRIITDFVGPGAIRAHSNEGVSNLFFLEVGAAGTKVLTSENKTNWEEAQEISIPAIVEGSSANLGGHYYRFAAKGGQTLEVSAKAFGSNFDGVITIRGGAFQSPGPSGGTAIKPGPLLAQADDSEVFGLDPWLHFIPPDDGDYVVELIDSQYRGGQAYQLRVGEPEQTTPERDVWEGEALVYHHDDESEEPLQLSSHSVIYGRFGTALDSDSFSFRLPAKRFVKITPTARNLRSPVTPRLTLTRADQVIAETPTDAFDGRPLLAWLEAGTHRISIRDAFGRHGSDCRYRLEVYTEAAPFDLRIPAQPDKKHPLLDKFLAVPGGVFEVPVQCQRHGYDGPIDLRVESTVVCLAENGTVEAKQGNANLRVRVPRRLTPGTLTEVWVAGEAVVEGHRYEQSLRTAPALAERDRNVSIPDAVDGALAVRVVERPVVVDVTPPREVARGESINIPVKLGWLDEARRFNTTLILSGLPDGVQSAEKKLTDKDTATDLELKVENPKAATLKNLRVDVRLDYHGQSLRVESEPFTIGIVEKDETKS